MSIVKLLQGDCLQRLKDIKDNSVDSVVTDPPYEIGFMGKGWDDSGIANNPQLWKEVLRVLKPGGHLLSFSHSRTYHRQAVAVEDAGFEIRDQIMWIYGSGFPKSHNIGKSVDKLQGNERIPYERPDFVARSNKTEQRDSQVPSGEKGKYTKGNSPYEGWGTALKPAHEPIVMARKPLDEKTVAKNVLEWGTGGINVDGCRVGTSGGTKKINTNNCQDSLGIYGDGLNGGKVSQINEGRFPANIIFDEEAGKVLDEQSGTSKSSIYDNSKGNTTGFHDSLGRNKLNDRTDIGGYNDTGGASRFFYCPKASKKDRNDGCDELEEKMSGHSATADKCGKCGKYLIGSNGTCKCEEPERTYIASKNHHPTVKPTDLMAYLVRLVTPKGGTVLDPFMGSGSTGKAAVREGFDFIGIEREDEYMEIAKTRIEHEQSKNKHQQFFK